MAQLGWIAGPLSMLFFASVTYVSTFLLSNCYRSPDPEFGTTRNGSYLEAVHLNLGDGIVKGSIGGVSTSSTTQKGWLVSQALGDIVFAYPYSILIEIQDTLKSPTPENKTMKAASVTAILITTFFYLFCGGFGYAAFGDQTPGSLLTGLGFYEPYWLTDFANACIVLHIVGGYQVYSPAFFAVVDKWFAESFPNSGFLHDHYTLKLPSLPSLRLNFLRLCSASTTAIAMILVLGVLGAMNFWALSIYFPVEMYFVQMKIRPWTTKWIVLHIFSISCLFMTAFVFGGLNSFCFSLWGKS